MLGDDPLFEIGHNFKISDLILDFGKTLGKRLGMFFCGNRKGGMQMRKSHLRILKDNF